MLILSVFIYSGSSLIGFGGFGVVFFVCLGGGFFFLTIPVALSLEIYKLTSVTPVTVAIMCWNQRL